LLHHYSHDPPLKLLKKNCEKKDKEEEEEQLQLYSVRGA
jgi:hypothetical protein